MPHTGHGGRQGLGCWHGEEWHVAVAEVAGCAAVHCLACVLSTLHGPGTHELATRQALGELKRIVATVPESVRALAATNSTLLAGMLTPLLGLLEASSAEIPVLADEVLGAVVQLVDEDSDLRAVLDTLGLQMQSTGGNRALGQRLRVLHVALAVPRHVDYLLYQHGMLVGRLVGVLGQDAGSARREAALCLYAVSCTASGRTALCVDFGLVWPVIASVVTCMDKQPAAVGLLALLDQMLEPGPTCVLHHCMSGTQPPAPPTQETPDLMTVLLKALLAEDPDVAWLAASCTSRIMMGPEGPAWAGNKEFCDGLAQALLQATEQTCCKMAEAARQAALASPPANTLLGPVVHQVAAAAQRFAGSSSVCQYILGTLQAMLAREHGGVCVDASLQAVLQALAMDAVARGEAVGVIEEAGAAYSLAVRHAGSAGTPATVAATLSTMATFLLARPPAGVAVCLTAKVSCCFFSRRHQAGDCGAYNRSHRAAWCHGPGHLTGGGPLAEGGVEHGAAACRRLWTGLTMVGAALHMLQQAAAAVSTHGTVDACVSTRDQRRVELRGLQPHGTGQAQATQQLQDLTASLWQALCCPLMVAEGLLEDRQLLGASLTAAKGLMQHHSQAYAVLNGNPEAASTLLRHVQGASGGEQGAWVVPVEHEVLARLALWVCQGRMQPVGSHDWDLAWLALRCAGDDAAAGEQQHEKAALAAYGAMLQLAATTQPAAREPHHSPRPGPCTPGRQPHGPASLVSSAAARTLVEFLARHGDPDRLPSVAIHAVLLVAHDCSGITAEGSLHRPLCSFVGTLLGGRATQDLAAQLHHLVLPVVMAGTATMLWQVLDGWLARAEAMSPAEALPWAQAVAASATAAGATGRLLQILLARLERGLPSAASCTLLLALAQEHSRVDVVAWAGATSCRDVRQGLDDVGGRLVALAGLDQPVGARCMQLWQHTGPAPADVETYEGLLLLCWATGCPTAVAAGPMAAVLGTLLQAGQAHPQANRRRLLLLRVGLLRASQLPAQILGSVGCLQLAQWLLHLLASPVQHNDTGAVQLLQAGLLLLEALLARVPSTHGLLELSAPLSQSLLALLQRPPSEGLAGPALGCLLPLLQAQPPLDAALRRRLLCSLHGLLLARDPATQGPAAACLDPLLATGPLGARLARSHWAGRLVLLAMQKSGPEVLAGAAVQAHVAQLLACLPP